jgi:hypothetical protein
MTARHILSAIALAAAAFLCAPTAHAQSIDCSTDLGLRVCANPDLMALEQERQSLTGELSGLDPAHSSLSQQTFFDTQQACPDDACLQAGYLDHNQSLRLTLESLRTPQSTGELEELPELELPTIRPERERADDGAREINPDPPFRWQDYLGALIAFAVSLLIASWLWNKAARARRGD